MCILKGIFGVHSKFKTMGSQIGHVINYLNFSFIAPFVSILLQDDDVFPKNKKKTKQTMYHNKSTFHSIIS